MPNDDPDQPKPKPVIATGQDLSFLGVAELTARIEALESEIARTKAEITKRQSTRAAAESVFKI